MLSRELVAIGVVCLLAPGCGSRGGRVSERVAEPAPSVPAPAPLDVDTEAVGDSRPLNAGPRDAFERRLFRWGVFHWALSDAESGDRCVSFRSRHERGAWGLLIEQNVPEGRPPLQLQWSYDPGQLRISDVLYGELLTDDCRAELDVELEESGAVLVQGARWYAAREACDASVQDGTATLFDMGTCGPAAARLRRILERGPVRNARLSGWLRDGGHFFWTAEGDDGPECQEVAVTRPDDGSLGEGSLAVDDRVRGEGAVATWGYSFGEYSRLMLIGPGVVVHRRGEEPRGMYMNCVQVGHVEDRATNGVAFDGSPWFPTRRACVRHLRHGSGESMGGC